jgi:hypothetical protein
VAEIVIRLVAYGAVFFEDTLNNLDVIAMCLQICDIIIEQNHVGGMTLLRTFDAVAAASQLIRGYRIIRLAETIEKLFHSIFSVLPNAISMLFIMTIFLYLYTVIGMDMFAYLRTQTQIDGYDLHYRDFFSAMFTLIRVTSREGWWSLMAESANTINPAFACN